MTHDEAILRVLEGDGSTFEVVVVAFQQPLRAFVARFCRDPHRSDEIAQRVFIWAFEHLREYSPGTHLGAWLKSIARMFLLSDLERVEREARNRERYLAHLETSRARVQLSAKDDTEPVVVALRECLDSLPGPSRELVDDRYGKHRPLDEIARSRGSTEGGIKMTLLRVRQALRRCIEGKMTVTERLEAPREA